ncbi:AlpA family transcriptional regulator [uncultured Corynebacterium sp.]|uniref:helix-turn-helix transcriptional regulator n=1 Tax=uncultured Corynebacterium sp. TaxID=159447 RepID=UPI0025D156FD|nr:helix-turn-helix domain-containing protein [uncultured Corynebacterium sp.]
MSKSIKATYTVEEAAKILGLGKSSAYAAVRNGQFPTKVIKIGGRYIIPAKELNCLLGIE